MLTTPEGPAQAMSPITITAIATDLYICFPELFRLFHVTTPPFPYIAQRASVPQRFHERSQLHQCYGSHSLDQRHYCEFPIDWVS